MRTPWKKCLLSICDIIPSKLGSFEEFLISLTERLNEKKIKHIIVFRGKPIRMVEEALLKKGAEIEIFKPSKSSIINFLLIYKIIKKVNPSIVHFHFYPIYTIINYLGIFSSIKVVYTDHMGYRTPTTSLKKIARRVYYYTSFKLFSAGIDRIVCVSDFVMEKYPKQYGIDPRKMCVIYNGINVDRFKKSFNITEVDERYKIKDKIVVTSVGLRKDKGPHYLIEAAPLILTQIPDAIFMLVGEGECKSYLKELVEERNLTDRVIFTGSLQDMVPIYNITSCVVIPSECEEAFCFVAAEAMATETNVIAFDSGAIEEVIFDKGQLVSKNPTSLSERVVKTLKTEDKIETKKMRNHIIKNFSLYSCITDYIYLYESLLKKT